MWLSCLGEAENGDGVALSGGHQRGHPYPHRLDFPRRFPESTEPGEGLLVIGIRRIWILWN